MKSKYSGTNGHMVLSGKHAFGTLMELMNNQKVQNIFKDDSYILFRTHTGEFRPSYSRDYKPTSYERRCIDKHKKSL
jgi:hypothetical protein